MAPWRIAATLAFTLCLTAANASNMSGSWHLDVAKSKWGKPPKPVSVGVNIDHREPALDYSGNIVLANGEDARNFTFHGAIDGKEYPIVGEQGEGKITIRRVSRATIASDFKSNDGRFQETSRTTISSNGKEMVREMHTKAPDGETSWTEVYERQ